MPQTAATAPQKTEVARKHRMEMLARAQDAELEAAWDALEAKPSYSRIRGPETGLVMIRGRIGGGGSPFNLGEATVTRATIRLQTGETGFGQALGLSLRKAELSAVLDAMAEREQFAAWVEQLVLAIATRIAAEDQKRAEETAATRVNFFTMVRGED
jgi:alpha-D-ribose 1-methylphosphonate 5-triphosphate synthase subunit PhnG